MAVTNRADAFLTGGGEMGALMRAHDWSTSPLDAPENWPQCLRSAVSLMLPNKHVMFVAWGPELAFLYNDAYRPVFGKKHPWALGRPFREVWSEVWSEVEPLVNAALGGEATWSENLHLVLERNGYSEDCWFTFSYSPVRDEHGAVVGLFCAASETTDTVLTERRLKDQTERQRLLFEKAPGFIAVLNGPDHVFEFVNDAYGQLAGPREFLGRAVRDVFPELETQGLYDLLDGVYATGKRFVAKRLALTFHDRPDQQSRDVVLDFIYEPIRDEAGNISGIFVEGHDATETHRVEVGLRESEARYQALFAASPVPFMVLAPNAPDFTILAANDAYFAATLTTRENLVGRRLFDVFPDDPGRQGQLGSEALAISLERVLTTLTTDVMERVRYDLATAEGVFEPNWWQAINAPMLDASGEVSAIIHQVTRVTDQRQAQQALIESEARYRAVFEQVGIGVSRISLDGRFIEVNDRFCTIIGRTREELVGASWQGFTHLDYLATEIDKRDQLLAGGIASFAIEKRYLGKEDREIWVNFTLSLVRDAADDPTFFVAMVEDIRARKVAEAALSASEARLRAVLDAAPVGLVFADATGQITHGNARLAEIVGHPIFQSPDVDAYDEYVSFHADGRQVEAREYPLARVLAGDAERAELEVLYRRGDGRDVWLRIVASAVRNANGALLGGVAASLDIDREKRLTDQLMREVEHAVAERQTALAQLLEAQKLETIGQLTGGVAHDFNNLLTPIMGVLEMMQDRVSGEERTTRMVSGALQSAERAKNLVQRLLAFARRQHLETKAVDLACLIGEMRDLIARSIGPMIVVEIALDKTLGLVSADANQLELALLNLAVNARDAMPDGGTLRYAARNEDVQIRNPLQLGPGSYVCLAVSDTGTGMDAETLKRCIEPFYTSKGVGEGTGLGLSMVHGMMRQLGGALNIVSAPGQGTTMQLWLPRSEEKAEARTTQHDMLTVAARRSTILLVDDEQLVREATADMLERLGYDVVQAGDSASALELLAGPATIDALVTDYLMPGMTGRELATRARQDSPDLPVLLITGYTRLDEIGPELARLEKPFRQAELGARLADLVGNR